MPFADCLSIAEVRWALNAGSRDIQLNKKMPLRVLLASLRELKNRDETGERNALAVSWEDSGAPLSDGATPASLIHFLTSFSNLTKLHLDGPVSFYSEGAPALIAKMIEGFLRRQSDAFVSFSLNGFVFKFDSSDWQEIFNVIGRSSIQYLAINHAGFNGESMRIFAEFIAKNHGKLIKLNIETLAPCVPEEILDQIYIEEEAVWPQYEPMICLALLCNTTITELKGDFTFFHHSVGRLLAANRYVAWCQSDESRQGEEYQDRMAQQAAAQWLWKQDVCQEFIKTNVEPFASWEKAYGQFLEKLSQLSGQGEFGDQISVILERLNYFTEQLAAIKEEDVYLEPDSEAEQEPSIVGSAPSSLVALHGESAAKSAKSKEGDTAPSAADFLSAHSSA